MIASKRCLKALFTISFSMLPLLGFSQETSDTSKSLLNLNNEGFYQLRGNNVFDIAGGSSVINGDFENPLFEIYFHAGYKRYIFPYLNINIGYNKFNLAYEDVFDNGFMSLDLNLEYTLLPNNRFTPFVFVGAGYNASNYFEQLASKVQTGIGFEYIVADGFGLKLFTDYSFVFSDELDGLETGDTNDAYIRMGFGLNIYFARGKQKPKFNKDVPTIINSNPIIHNK